MTRKSWMPYGCGSLAACRSEITGSHVIETMPDSDRMNSKNIVACPLSMNLPLQMNLRRHPSPLPRGEGENVGSPLKRDPFWFVVDQRGKI
jgi:hypothetical protein